MRVSVVDDELLVSVSDNGRGMPPTSPTESGLLNLRRRAQMVGGSMTTEPGADGRGFVLTWRAPLEPAAAPVAG